MLFLASATPCRSVLHRVLNGTSKQVVINHSGSMRVGGRKSETLDCGLSLIVPSYSQVCRGLEVEVLEKYGGDDGTKIRVLCRDRQ